MLKDEPCGTWSHGHFYYFSHDICLSVLTDFKGLLRLYLPGGDPILFQSFKSNFRAKLSSGLLKGESNFFFVSCFFRNTVIDKSFRMERDKHEK